MGAGFAPIVLNLERIRIPVSDPQRYSHYSWQHD